jgi:hypothetical protein
MGVDNEITIPKIFFHAHSHRRMGMASILDYESHGDIVRRGRPFDIKIPYNYPSVLVKNSKKFIIILIL